MTVSTPNEVPCRMRGSDFRGVEARSIGDAHAMHVVLRFTSACVCAYRTMDRLAMTIEAV